MNLFFVKQLPQRLAQLVHPQAQPGVNRAKRQAQPLGDLAPGQAVPEHQLDHIALRDRQLSEAPAGSRHAAAPLQTRDRSPPGAGGYHRRSRGDILAAPAAQLIDRTIVGDREHPRGQAALAGLVTIKAAPAAHEDILRDLLSRAAILNDPQCHAEDQPPVAIIERGDAGSRLLAQQRHQLNIARRHCGSHFIHIHGSFVKTGSRDCANIVAWNADRADIVTWRQATDDEIVSDARICVVYMSRHPRLTPTTISIERQAGTALVSSQSAPLAATRSGWRSSRRGSTPTCSQASEQRASATCRPL